MPRVAVVVENIEHAIELAKQLPRWPVITGRGVTVEGLSAEARSLLERRSWNESRGPNRMIITLAGLENFDAELLDVVIRAEGGEHLPSAIENLTITNNRKYPALELIDCDDHHHPLLRKWSRARRNEYDRRGWIGDKPLVERKIERFLSSRPEVMS